MPTFVRVRADRAVVDGRRARSLDFGERLYLSFGEIRQVLGGRDEVVVIVKNH